MPRRLHAEPHVVRVQRGRVPVVVVDDRQPDALGQRAPDIEAAPAGVAEVRRALRRDDALRAGGAGRVQPDRADRRERHAGEPEHPLHRIDQGRDGLVRALSDVAGNFRHLLEEEPALGVENRAVVRRAAVIQAHDHPVDWHTSSSSGR